ncbi:CoA pyrophosphatase [Perlucidibaca aquatica]|jgi:8-oxo-dGTP pyrophosphatase MutT (NUDIX family)|uniref:CoA pyrophosphatase n=1 Tax=Perlucidibaca aquatica TaxID=1852776 RepID=UPI00083AAD7E|nr:CoA pyrophosphatase [Perlucidibaca aquatica]
MTQHSQITTLRQNLADQAVPLDGADAAVLIAIFTGSGEPEVLLTRRPTHMTSHAGEVAFPGGKRDASDASLTDTALRESEEEVALPRACVEILGALKPARAKSGIKVLPVVGWVRDEPALIGNPDEVESLFRVPLRFFFEQKPARDHRINFRGIDLVVPCFRYDGYIIWGLTAYMLVEFMRQGFDHAIDYPWPPILPGVLVPQK